MHLVTFALASLALVVHGRRLWKGVQVSSKRSQQSFTELLTAGAAFNPSSTEVRLSAGKPTLSRGSVVSMKDAPGVARKGPKWDQLLREYYGLGLPVGGDELNHLIAKLESESPQEQEPGSVRRKDSSDPQMSASAPSKAPPKAKAKISPKISKMQQLLRQIYGLGLPFGGQALDNLATQLESELSQQKSGVESSTSELGVSASKYIEAGFGKPGPTWTGPTGTSFLPPETIERAKRGNPSEKAKLEKDPTSAFNDIYAFAAAVRAGELNWEDVEKSDMNTRLKWVGLLHRAKRNPGTFMMRLRTPNGIITSDLMRFYADSVEPYGPDVGVIDITTRQNIQLRGVTLQDADKIIDGLHARGQTSIQSAFDNVRNMVGSPLAGIDDKEMVDTRDICKALNDLITVNKETGERGNPQWGNLPRKFNIAVSGGRDDFAHTHINDIGLQPCVHAKTGEMGFNVVLGGYMSKARVAASIDMDLWIPATIEAAVTLSTAILRIFRDEGTRDDRNKARLMWLIESYGPVEEVDGHLRCDSSYRDAVVKEMESYGSELQVDHQQPRPTSPFERRSLLGVHPQPQDGKSFVGIHVPVGRLSVAEAREVAKLADKYSAGEIRLTVEQNIILPNVDNAKIDELLAEPSLTPSEGSRLSVNPGNIVGNVVSCTGAQYCGFAIIETKNNAEAIAKELEKRVKTTRPLRIHWTGCPNSCGQVQAADIGLMGGPAKKRNAEGKLKAVAGCKIFVGGKIGEQGHLSLDPYVEGIPLDWEVLIPTLTDIIVKKFGGEVYPEYIEQQEAWAAAQDQLEQ